MAKRRGAGRKAKPDALRVLEGQQPREQIATGSYEIAPGGCPDWLADAHPLASECWDALAPILNKAKVTQQLDGVALTMLVQVYAEWREATEVIADEGISYTSQTKGGYRVFNHPAVAQRSDAWRRLHSMIAEFGMTPASRGKVDSSSGSDHDPFDDL